MSTEPSAAGLLARDRERLDRVARAIRQDRRAFFTIVCGEELVASALAYLCEQSGRDVPAPEPLRSAESTLRCLTQISQASRSDLVSVSMGAEDAEAFRTLNWHREKVLAGGRVLLWLFSTEALQAFRKLAPDAYSYREAVLVLEGERRTLPEGDWEEGEPAEIRAARVMWELGKTPEERAEAGLRLAGAFLAHERRKDAESIALQALALVPREEHKLVREATTRIRLHDMLANIYFSQSQRINAYRSINHLLQEIGPDLAVSFRYYVFSARLQREAVSPLGISRESMKKAQEQTDPTSADLLQRPIAPLFADSLCARGRFAQALMVQQKALEWPKLALATRAALSQYLAKTFAEAGRFKEAQDACAAADALFHRASLPTPHRMETELLLLQGELSAAEKLDPHCAYHGALIQIKKGNLAPLFDTLPKTLEANLSDHVDAEAFQECLQWQTLTTEARAANALSKTDRDCILQIITQTGRSLLTYAAHDPPWYDVLVPSLLAATLSQLLDSHDEAIASARKACELASSHWKQALPQCKRILAQCLAAAKQWKEMKMPLLEGMKAARDEDHLIELAKLQAYDLARQLQLHAAPEHIATAREVLQRTFDEMAAPRVEAETWLLVMPYIPLQTNVLDLVDILERVHDLFSDMPMPEGMARAMEWLGDLYRARGDERQAISCYRMAQTRLDRHGFALRRPLLQSKINLS